ncbi:MAG TPA: hypothetical protein GX699_11015 [Firmicutes bacterium]|nr:hypothetical protein [Bacillota bacterium]
MILSSHAVISQETLHKLRCAHLPSFSNSRRVFKILRRHLQAVVIWISNASAIS